MDEQQDIDAAAEHQQTLDEQRLRENVLLGHAATAHQELQRIQHETTETCKALNWALDRIFRP